jgi:hypothetical protein
MATAFVYSFHVVRADDKCHIHQSFTGTARVAVHLYCCTRSINSHHKDVGLFSMASQSVANTNAAALSEPNKRNE